MAHETNGFQSEVLIHHLRALRRGSGRCNPIALVYHSVASDNKQPQWEWAVSLRQFRAHLDILCGEGWQTTTVRQLSADPASWVERSAAITFDDGYSDNLAACEELLRRGMCATVFAVSGAIGQPPTWRGAAAQPKGNLLSAQALRQLMSAGIEIGSHSVNHVRLTELDQQALRHEVVNSKAALEDALGSEVSSFAYPYGAWNEHCMATVKAAGYRAACTTDSGWALLDKNPYRIRRLSIMHSDTRFSFACKLRFATNDVSFGSLARYALARAVAKISPQNRS